MIEMKVYQLRVLKCFTIILKYVISAVEINTIKEMMRHFHIIYLIPILF